MSEPRPDDAAGAFARANRRAIVRRALAGLIRVIAAVPDAHRTVACERESVRSETHEGVTAWIDRDGGTHVPTGPRGVVPGSMGASDHVVVGTRAVAALDPYAHGADRSGPRGVTRRRIDLRALADATTGDCFDVRKSAAPCDETQQTYTDVAEVMRAPRDLIRPGRTPRSLVHEGARCGPT